MLPRINPERVFSRTRLTKRQAKAKRNGQASKKPRRLAGVLEIIVFLHFTVMVIFSETTGGL